MLILITGGAWQGKSAFAKSLAREGNEEFQIIEDVHLLVKNALQQGLDPRKDIEERICPHANVILTVDELGCGIVPMEAFDRSWREITGRICCDIARRADRFYRLICGIPVRIK